MDLEKPDAPTSPSPDATPSAATPRGKAQAAATPPKVEEPEDGRKAYTVTERAGPRVAGQLVGEDRTIRLTDAEARSELLDGTIVARGDALHSMFTGAKAST